MVLQYIVEKSVMFDEIKREYIETLYKEYKKYGIIIINGEEVKMYEMSGTEIIKLGRHKVNISNNQRKGGQSAQRFGRIRDNEIYSYITLCIEMCNKYYLEEDIPMIEGLIIGGYGEKKNKLYENLHPKLKKMCQLLTITDKDNIITIRD